MKQLQSENLNELFGALSKAQGEFGTANKDSLNPFFKSKYADLASFWNACKSGLAANGLSIVQCTDEIESRMFLITTLGHSSGQWIRSYMPIITQKMDAQSLGSALTYMRRYSLSAILGLVTDEDDDGEKAGRIKLITQQQITEISQLINSCDNEFIDKIFKALHKQGITSLDKIPEPAFPKIKSSCLHHIESKKNGMEQSDTSGDNGEVR